MIVMSPHHDAPPLRLLVPVKDYPNLVRPPSGNTVCHQRIGRHRHTWHVTIPTDFWSSAPTVRQVQGHHFPTQDCPLTCAERWQETHGHLVMQPSGELPARSIGETTGSQEQNERPVRQRKTSSSPPQTQVRWLSLPAHGLCVRSSTRWTATTTTIM